MYVIRAGNASTAWVEAVAHLLDSGGQCFNMMVSIQNPAMTVPAIEREYEDMLLRHNLLTVKQVVYTVFPVSLYEECGRDADKLFDRYNRSNGVYDRLKRRHRRFGWGSYFRRMTCYPTVDTRGRPVVVNQLGDIIGMLGSRRRNLKARYTVSIGVPGQDCRRVVGGPCLAHLALQIPPASNRLDLLAVYRNHDFVQRAYGNYVSLGHLIQFLSGQTGYEAGTLHCLSSHADTANLSGSPKWPSRTELRQLVSRFRQP